MGEKYIFIDFDGVMTSTVEQPGSYLVENGEYGISPTPARLLADFIRGTNIKIIISSNWRRVDNETPWIYAGRKFYNPLSTLKTLIGDAYGGVLPAEKHITKSEALEKWFRAVGKSPDEIDYVVLDDDLREGFQAGKFREHFILTDYRTGLTVSDIEKMKGILNNG